MITVEVSDDVMVKLRELASERDTDVPGVLAEAIGLVEAYVQARRRGGRILIEERGRKISELEPGNARVPGQRTAKL